MEASDKVHVASTTLEVRLVDENDNAPAFAQPFYQISLNQPRGRFYRLADLIAGDLEESPYYQHYYGDTGTVDEIIFLAGLPDGSVLNISLMRRAHRGMIDNQDFELLRTLASGLVGCSTAESRRASLLDPELKGSLELEVQKPELNDAGQLLAQATIVNRMPDSQHVMIQTMFFDIEGNPIEPGATLELQF